MLDLLGYIFFIIAGIFFGLFGSGGSIIIIPILIYLFQTSIYEATTYSLLIVFILSLFGTVRHIKNKNLDINEISFFLIPTLLFTSISRVFIFPAIPDYINMLSMSKESMLMILFSIVIFISGSSLLKNYHLNFKYDLKFLLFFIGAIVGLLTGLLGIGGGFIIVPALILCAGMNMRKAAASALLIIMLNTFLAIILEITIFNFQFNFFFIVILFFSGIIGLVIGMKLLDILDLNVTRKLFSITLIVLSCVIFLFELIKF